MSRIYHDELSGPYISDRQRLFEERRKKTLIEQAKQESTVLQKLRIERAEQRATEKLLFCMWYLLDTELQKYEKQRDEHAPKHPDDPWDEPFCEAIQYIPILRHECENVWFEYVQYGR